VKPVAIVDGFDEVTDRAASVLDVAIAARLNLFVLERLHEALRLGIIVGVADAAHAGRDAMCGEHRGVVGTCILHPAIGVMDQAAWWRPACRKRHGERLHRQARLQVIG
jgi:hypothetical protein